jgi:hypothetical protein
LQSRACGILETDIQYVITVPAIWDPKAKQFMRRAAYKVNQSFDISRFDFGILFNAINTT